MLSVSSTNSLVANREELLKFFDEKHDAEKGDATAVVAIIGEDLNTAVFQHYIEAKDGRLDIIPGPVTPGGRKGPWLDRWIRITWNDGSTILYQTEIKNNAAGAIGGEMLRVNSTCQEVADYKQRRWEAHWDSEYETLTWYGRAKVLVRMKVPDDFADQDITVQPLLILWEAVGPRGLADDHLFSTPVTYDFRPRVQRDWPAAWVENLEKTKLDPFEQLSVFSVSSYLRSLNEPEIRLPMPNAARRVQTINRLFH